METPHYRHLFGPVPSRRLGWSLGVDLVLPKTCTLDCVFCQLGRTTTRTTERREYVPVSSVVEEVEDWLGRGGEADSITIAGSGEPTLHERFGEITDRIRERTEMPVTLLTNGTLLCLPEVREAARRAHRVKVTLCAWNDDLFARIHRPAPGVTFDLLVEGGRRLREEIEGEIWLEVFVLRGINDTPDDARRIAEIARTIRPDRVHLNTCVRPPSERFAEAVPDDVLEALGAFFDPKGEVAHRSFPTRSEDPDATVRASVRTTMEDREGAILDILRRRPGTAAQLGAALRLHPNEISKYLGRLVRGGRIREERRADDVFFSAVFSVERVEALDQERGTSGPTTRRERS